MLYIDPYGLAVQAVLGLGGTLNVPGTGGGVSLNLGVNFDWWNSSVYLQAQGNLGAPAAGGYFVGAGGNFEFADTAAPSTGLDSAPYWEADVGVLGGLGAFGSPDDCGNLNLGAMRGTKGGFAVGGGIYSGATNTATTVSPTLGQMMSAFNSFAPDGGI
ncbi:hypothetical protein EKH79_03475 [Dyella dinghuensis]|uniref:Uncharacterized protein n=1 Tax=Dyella dinghuensis TaxID=1920169 RepID=A0A3S0RF48_9GAMM|nr:hypothetical protein [Dyella dinghuensis]RUL65785.1 hypothetical protein EKH79_03475 [Dyella dinghuensis]